MRTVDPEKHAQKRAGILVAAAEEFAANGVDGTSTASICRRAGIGSGTLFHYFPTKRDIVHGLFGDAFERMVAIYEEAEAEKDPEAGFDRVLQCLFDDLANPLTPGLMAVALLQVGRDEEFARMVVEDEERARRTVTVLLRRMAERGTRLAFAPERAAAWVQHLFDASFLASGNTGFDAAEQTVELRALIGWLVGGGRRST
ncbi:MULTISPECIES: TetR/AcrR family transcriptional regulator [Phyllobacteriaceae]|jgi:AcrR family transcriptional regulator|uniref:TetR family transcriptional regulator n=1 Tax=Mesorhizobium hungaricum TaxID=1566387 RepID=A0A1C2DYH3_9HYPH|nr:MULTISPECIES: TetR/AcrR family transcriptional regulator [Mesorhizobium]MBN9234783.1 TetR/AcrR family transcriptional regulator [Mesorhizobium sp.]MDQ0328736.1 AcrR family transcriptional regulator [Mesorhizobium sp. YL-MeA3-2017]OCX19804.1 TetR family transcriptional regulator [Mesorhizobium hungaricum]